MKKIMLGLMATVAMLVAGGDIAPIAQVDEASAPSKDFYVGGSLTAIGRSSDLGVFDSGAWDETAYGIGAQAGWVFFRSGDFSTSIEGRASYAWDNGVLGDTWTIGAFIKPEYDFGTLSVYGLAGYSRIFTDEIGGDNGFTWGLGAEVPVAENLTVFVDYTSTANLNPSYSSSADFDYNVVTLGLNYKF